MKIVLQNDIEPEISMSPLIDCVFLLLIFFLVAGMTKVKNKDIPIDLPASSSAVRMRPDDKQIVVGIDHSGGLYWEGEPCSTNYLHQSLRETGLTNPGQRIRVDLDRKVPFGRFVEVMDACQFYNLSNVGIRTYDESYNRG
ncbi:MAG: biopolymer transporter ExbD [Actinobacteria bacterium]|nr:biopolymer transporter ExbD [Actinomycetota bacterium]